MKHSEKEMIMASRIIHLAIIEKLKKQIDVKSINRLRLGVLLPDAYNGYDATADSHLKINTCNGTMKTYDLNHYRNTFGELMKKDDLYLGYYLHLIQDMAFRYFVYEKHKWNPMIPGNVEKLHNDYRLINCYVAQKYSLESEIYIPKDFEKEPINDLYRFDIVELMKNFQNDFLPYDEGDIFFFTKEMADSFIHEAVEICKKEVEAIFSGGELMNQENGAWRRM